MQKLLRHDFVRFCIVGASGFVVNTILLTLFYRVAHSPLFVAQIVAAEFSLFSNFMFHHNWTYKDSDVRKSLMKLIVQFHLASWVAVLGSAAIVTIGVHSLHLNYIAALVLAAGAATFWNYCWSKFMIWRTYSHGSRAE